MTAPMPGQQQGPGVAAPRAAPVALVLSREVKAGHEQAFEDVLHRLAAEVRPFLYPPRPAHPAGSSP